MMDAIRLPSFLMGEQLIPLPLFLDRFSFKVAHWPTRERFWVTVFNFICRQLNHHTWKTLKEPIFWWMILFSSIAAAKILFAGAWRRMQIFTNRFLGNFRAISPKCTRYLPRTNWTGCDTLIHQKFIFGFTALYFMTESCSQLLWACESVTVIQNYI